MGDFVTASRTTFQDPDVDVRRHQRRARWTPHKLRGVPVVGRRARGAHGARGLSSGRAGYAGTRPAYRDARHGAQGGVGRRSSTRLRAPNDEPGDLGQAEVIGIVNDAVGGHATVICAAGSLPGDLLRLWRPEDPKAYHVEYGFSCMGYEIAAGLGVRLADPDRDVVVMVGDGSYLMLNSEIVTAVAEGLKLTIVAPRQPRLPVHPRPPAPGRRARLRQRAALPRRRQQPAERPVRPDRLPGARRVDGRAGAPRVHAGRAARCARAGTGRRPGHGHRRADRAGEADARLRVVVGRAGRRRERPGHGAWRRRKAYEQRSAASSRMRHIQ